MWVTAAGEGNATQGRVAVICRFYGKKNVHAQSENSYRSTLGARFSANSRVLLRGRFRGDLGEQLLWRRGRRASERGAAHALDLHRLVGLRCVHDTARAFVNERVWE